MARPAPDINKDPRIVAFDVLRVFAILAVITIHVLMRYRGLTPRTSPVAIVDRILHFAVPVFFFLSGTLVWGKSPADAPRRTAARIRAVAIPYVAWSVLYIVVTTARQGSGSGLVHAVQLVLLGKAWYHLYFVPTLIVFYLVTPLVAPVARKRPELLMALAYLVRVVGAPLVPLVLGPGTHPASAVTTAVIVHFSDVALGAWFATRKRVLAPVLRRWYPVLVVAGLSALVVASTPAWTTWAPALLRHSVTPLATVATLGGLLGAASSVTMHEAGARTLSRLAALTFGVYLVHPIFILAMNAAMHAAGLDPLWHHAWMPILGVGLIATASFATSSALAASRWSSWLVSASSPQRPARRDDTRRERLVADADLAA